MNSRRRRRVKAIRSKTAYVSVNERKTDITGDAGRMSRCWITVFLVFLHNKEMW